MDDKKERKKSSLPIRILRGFSVFAIIGGLSAIIFTGINAAAMIVLIAGLSLLIGPPVADGGGIGEIISGIFEAIVEGLTAVLEAIASFFSSLSP